MFGLVEKFNLVSHLHWAAWALIQVRSSGKMRTRTEQGKEVGYRVFAIPLKLNN